MQNKLFKILNLNDNATSTEIEQAYKSKREKLREDMFLEGRAGNDAARDLTVLENSYTDYLNELRFSKNKEEEHSDNLNGNSYSNSSTEVFADIEAFVKAGKLNEAQEMLDNIQARNDKWHYHQAMVYFKKDWFTDSKKHLEKAIELNPNNEKYKTTLEKLSNMMSGKTGEQDPNKKRQGEEWWKQNDTINNDKDRTQPNWDDNNRQMGGCNESLNCCTQLLCMNLFCNCCGGGC